MSKKTIFLTGGSGFIGRNLIEQMGGRYEIVAPRHQELELTDERQVADFFKKQRFDIVIHSAVRPGHRNAKDPSSQLNINLRMFFNILRNRDKFGKLIFLSSGAVYDVAKPMVKVREEDFDKVVPGDEHGFSKYIISKHIAAIENAVELRIFGIFGKYEDYAIRFISNAICKTLFDLPITLRQDRKFDYLFVDDLTPVVEHFIVNKVTDKAYNVTPDYSIGLLALAQKVKEISGKNVPIQVGREGMGLEYSGDNARLRREMPGFKFTPLDEAVKKLFAWYEKNQGSIDKSVLLFDK